MPSGAVQINEGRVLKDAGRVSTGKDCCCGCCSGSRPDEFLVTLSGFTYGGVFCPGTNCYWPEGDTVLALVPSKNLPCHWEYRKGMVCSQVNRGIFLTVFDTYIQLDVANMFLSVRFEYHYEGSLDCRAIDNLDLPVTTVLGIPGGCRAVDPTAVLSAL